MDNPKVSLKSGKELELQSPSFSAATRLYKALCAELLKVDLSFNLADLKSIAGRDIGELKNIILQVVSSDAIEAAIFACAERSTIDGERITRTSFEAADSRRDWLPVALEVAKHALGPFFADLDFGLFEKAPSSPPPSPQ